jgi:L-fucose isomerase-like protein
MRLTKLTSKVGGKAAANDSTPRKRPARPAAPRVTLGVIVGNRGFFPGHLAAKGRTEMLRALEEEGIDAVIIDAAATNHGAIESRDEAKACAALFKANAARLDGIVVTLPNFGDERAVADTIRLSGLEVPVLVHATADDPAKMLIDNRRDAFCGKMSVCNVLSQYGIKYTLTSQHTQRPDSDGFRADLRRFAATCRVVKGLRGARIGAIGARPAAFKTVRYSEKLLEAHGISVEPIDLSEIMGRIGRLKNSDAAVKAKLADIQAYVDTGDVNADALLKMAKLGLVMDRWMKEVDVSISAIQCWTSMEEFFGVVPCTVMSMLSNANLSSACEVDVMGTISMHALTLASTTPAALLDWNNNYGDDPNKAVCFHCSNLPLDFFESAKMDYQEIIAGTVGRDNTWGTVVGKVKAGPMSFARFSTDERAGIIKGYVGEGAFTKDKLRTFGGAGVVEIPHLQQLLHHICRHGFEHHVAATFSHVADAVHEAAVRYLGWNVERHA